MKAIATLDLEVALMWLRRNPVLTALMVYSLVFAIAALTAVYIVSRINSSCPIMHRPGLFYLVRDVREIPPTYRALSRFETESYRH